MLKKLVKQYFLDKKYLPFTAIIIILIAIRFLWLDKFPVGINHDEVDVVLSAKSYWKFGRDLSGVPFPKSLFVTNTRAGLSGLPSFLLSPVYGPFTLSTSFARVPYVILSILIAFEIGIIVHLFTKNKRVSLISFLVALINPWLYLYSRSPTEAPFSLLFALLGIILLFKNSKSFYYSLIFFSLSFFSYQAAKPVIPLLVFGLVFIHRKFLSNKKAKDYLTYPLIFTGVIISYLILSSLISGSTLSYRKNELIFLNLNKYSDTVNEQRRASLDFNYKSLFFNKYIELTKDTLKRYVGALSPSYLFFTGDQYVTFEEYGFFYIFDLPFIFLGFVGLLKLKEKRERQLVYILLLLLIISPISSSLSLIGNQYIFRSFLLPPILIILIAFGVELFLKYFNQSKIIILIISLCYTYFFLYFLAIFFFRYSIKQQENHSLGERIVADYLIRATKDNEFVYVSADYPYAAFYEYVFFSNYLDKVRVLPDVNASEFKTDQIIFSGKCLNEEGIHLIEEKALKCEEKESDFLVIEHQKDAGAIFRIFNDTICKDALLTPYRRSHFVSDYDIEKMDNTTFCNRWINKYEE